MLKKSYSPLPGFGLSFGLVSLYLSIFVLLPLATILVGQTPNSLLLELSKPHILSAVYVSLSCSLIAALISLVLGIVVAWTLARYTFFGRGVMDLLVDIPFALPTAVAGIALTALYSKNARLGGFLYSIGITIAYTQLGIILALVFVGFPFVVRTLQPIIGDLDKDLEDASASLGANRIQTISRVIFPNLLPGCLTAFAMSFSRAIGEYGSVIFISGNIPGKTQIAPVAIMTRLEEFNYDGARAIAILMLLISLVTIVSTTLVNGWLERRFGQRGN